MLGIVIGTLCMTGIYIVGGSIVKPMSYNNFTYGYYTGLVSVFVGLLISIFL